MTLPADLIPAADRPFVLMMLGVVAFGLVLYLWIDGLERRQKARKAREAEEKLRREQSRLQTRHYTHRGSR